MNALEYAIATFAPVRIFALFSGGHDSLCSTHYAMTHGAQEVIHVNTGIGVEDTRTFVRETCSAMDWPLRELHPPDWTYRDMVVRRGFPGPAGHRYAYSWLKERALAKLTRETKRARSDKLLLVTGVRQQESSRRMGFVNPVIRTGARVWVAPIWDWLDEHKNAYIAKHRLPRNPVVSVLGFSGECLCGSFAKPHEMAVIQKHFPPLAKQIQELEDCAASEGKHCKWGERPPRTSAGQTDLPFMPLCAGCPAEEWRERAKQHLS